MPAAFTPSELDQLSDQINQQLKELKACPTTAITRAEDNKKDPAELAPKQW